GTVTFTGSGQIIGGNSITSFNNLVINSPDIVTLENEEKVTTLLTMTSGKLITTSTNILTCTSTGNATIGSDSSYIDGPMRHTVASFFSTSKNFPLGKNNHYCPF